jgi:hypothetical protein
MLNKFYESETKSIIEIFTDSDLSAKTLKGFFDSVRNAL